MSRRAGRWAAVMAWLLVAAGGCADTTGAGSADVRKATRPSRDVDEQVDAVMKDFKNE